jgi:hypothetical protein
MRSRRFATSKSGSGSQHWQTNFIGEPATQIEDRPQAELTEMTPNETIYAHFHQVDQFQVLVAGGGSMGRNTVSLLALHYVDHHTAYGPINAGPLGLSFFTLRARADPGSIYLHKPGYKEFLKPTKKRYLLSENIMTSTEPVLQNRTEVSLENVLADADGSDGLGATMMRIGACMKTEGPDPGLTGGQYYLVVNGSLQFKGTDYPAWSTIHIGSADAPLEVCAGNQGLETLVLNFPRTES